jgi:FkbM family methyltransferase
MDTFKEIKIALKTGKISKPEFIETMYARHKLLFEYADEIKNCNLDAIRISDKEIVAEFKEPKIKMICPAGDNRIAPVEAFNFGSFESAEINLVKRLVGHLGGASINIFDIGANAGFYSLALSHYFPGIKGVAFEPVPLTHSYLKRNLELNDIYEISALNLGLSDSTGELTFAVSAEHSGASFIATSTEGTNSQLIRCTVTTVDDFIAQGGTVPAFIKCDVEGAELFVFKGAKQLLTNNRPVIFTEMLRKWARKFDYHPNDIIRYFAELNYSCFIIRGEKLLPFDSVEENTADTNYIFLHKQNHFRAMAEFC